MGGNWSESDVLSQMEDWNEPRIGESIKTSRPCENSQARCSVFSSHNE